MKRRLLLGLAALAAVTFTSCQKDQVINETPQQNAIEFGTYIGKSAQTKATSIDNTTDLNNYAFGVYAYYTGQDAYSQSAPANFMRNQKVEIVGDKWSYSPIKYWPNNVNDKVTFFAYAPYTTDGQTVNVVDVPNNDATGDPHIKFQTSNVIADQHDLLYADNNNTDKTKQSINGKVTFNFKHALSRIGFTAQVMIDKISQDNTGTDDDASDESVAIDANTTITLNEIQVFGGFYKNGYLNLNGGNWTFDSTPEIIGSYTIYSADLHNTEALTITKTDLNTKTGADDKGYLMIIPKYFNGSDDANAVKIRVKYTVTTVDLNLDGGKSVIVNDITSAPFSINFMQGKAYNFALQLGMTSVKFDATVAEWQDGDDVAVNVPLNF